MQLPRSALRLGPRYAIFSDFYGDESDSFLTLRDQSLWPLIRNHALPAHGAAMGTQAYERICFVRGPASSKAVGCTYGFCLEASTLNGLRVTRREIRQPTHQFS
jgi:hypothetical protein